MKSHSKSIVAIIFVAILCAFLIGIPVLTVYRNISGDEQSNAGGGYNYQYVDWVSLYPFAETAENTSQGFNNKALNNYKNKCTSLTSSFELWQNMNTLFKYKFIYLYGKVNRLIGTKFIRDANDTTADLGNGYLAFPYGKHSPKSTVQNAVDCITDFEEYLAKQNTEFLCVICPSKYPDEEREISNIFTSWRYKQDKFYDKLTQSGTQVLNLYDSMPSDYDEYLSCFYKTDNHWKTETAFKATALVAKKIKNEFSLDFDLEVLSPQNYNYKTYKDLLLGSQGKKVGLGYIKPEDFTLITPKFDTKLHITVPQCNFDADGDFMTLIDEQVFKGNDVYSKSLYQSYGFGDIAFMQIENKNATNNTKILMLRDSFGGVVAPYLSLGCKQLDVLDLRRFNGSLKTYLEQNHYDIVIQLNNEAGTCTKETAQAHNSLFCFD